MWSALLVAYGEDAGLRALWRSANVEAVIEPKKAKSDAP